MGLLAGTGVAHAAPSLCAAGEKAAFSCTLSRSGKTVSLCDTGAGALAYRFGRPGKVELALARPYKDFRYARYFRSMVDRYEVSFDNGGYTYAVFDYRDETEKPPRMQGIATTKAGASGGETQQVCKGAATAALNTLESKLPCDRDNALSLGSCNP